ncbi:Glu/Leu/Phe/Val dehydrogenase family protein [Corallincola spongiicola]|uniref:Glu/Leu/Phe/Val dehydrogenase family protein n=1 Tax=Corallincola spongiicola TaxID=2520508 RepID=A0ABY1WVJ8_9GAMM|nr:Glu/Leu/Phe/Val dehydrogenase family protein [Corallincola spongiicola]TAA48754.1 Glu/Leu/Phe/Val dehydrogenase family protein [Corallincola spongiicola]
MSFFDLNAFDNHEEVAYFSDAATGLKAIIAVHSTKLGPAVGGCRLWRYADDKEALTDALRLSRGMTYKNAVAGVGFGGGKAVIIADRNMKTPEMMQAFGRAVARIGGRYYTAEDVGITPADIAEVAKETNFVAGLEHTSGDPSPFTATGTFVGIQASVKHLTGSDSLEGKSVAVQGVGHVGYYLCKHLANAGAKLIVTDVNQANLNRVVNDFDASVVEPAEIYDQEVDIYAPCALGATLNSQTLPRLKAKIVAGCANNQLATPDIDQALTDAGILYAPDYVINAGGIINISFERSGYCANKANTKVEKIYDTLSTLYQRASQENRPTGELADQLAQEILAAK